MKIQKYLSCHHLVLKRSPYSPTTTIQQQFPLLSTTALPESDHEGMRGCENLYPSNSINICMPGTQMTLVLIGKDLVLEGSTTKTNRFQVIYIIDSVPLVDTNQFHVLSTPGL